MEQNPKYPAQRLPGQEHIPLFPKGFIVLRFLQLTLGVVALGLTAYLLAVTISYPGDSLMIFTAVANLIVCVYYIVAAFGPKSIYNYWAVLSLDIFMLIFWLISFALLASEAALLFTYLNEVSGSYCDSYDDSGYCDNTVSYSNNSGVATVYAGCMAGAAGLGGILFVLYITSLALHSVALHRHRAAGLHCTPAGSGAATGTGFGAAPGQPPLAGGPVMMNPDLEKNASSSVVTPAYPSGVPPFMMQQQMQQQNAAAYSMHSMTPPPQQGAPQMYNGVPLQQPQPFYPPQVQGTPSPGPQGVQQHHVEPSYSDGSGMMAPQQPIVLQQQQQQQQQHMDPSHSDGSTMMMASSPPPGVHQLSSTPAQQGPYPLAPQ